MKTISLSLIVMLFAGAWGGIWGRSTGDLTILGDPLNTPVPVLAPESSGCGGVSAPMVDDEYEQQVVELVNAARLSNGNLPPLKRADGFGAAARYHAADLGQDNYFSHDSYDRSGVNLVYVCDTWTRIASYTPGANAENIAGGYSTPQSVVDAWMGSQGHRDNILTRASWELGVGYYQGSGNYHVYWVQDFGRRNGVYPLVINREAASTDTRQVSLYVYGNGTWSEMRLRNDGGVWTDWQPFQAQSSWTLGGGVGVHTVTAELRTGGVTVTSSDTINLTTDNSTPTLGGLPEEVHFMYSLSDQRLAPASFHVTPLNTGGTDALSWTAEIGGTWLSVTPGQGTTPDGFDIIPLPVSDHKTTTYTGTVTVMASSPGGAPVQGSPTTITVTMEVVESLVMVYLPELQR
jgi:uncharacterized protein YkwD